MHGDAGMQTSFRFGLPYVLLGLPLAYLLVTRQISEPWVVAVGVYYALGIVALARYEGFQYRVRPSAFWLLSLTCLGIALFAAAAYALFVMGSVDQLFAAKTA
jgi:hypothetical protein